MSPTVPTFPIFYLNQLCPCKRSEGQPLPDPLWFKQWLQSLKHFQWLVKIIARDGSPVTIHLGDRTDGKKNSVDSVRAINHRNQNNAGAYGQCTVVCVITLAIRGSRGKSSEVFFSR